MCSIFTWSTACNNQLCGNQDYTSCLARHVGKKSHSTCQPIQMLNLKSLLVLVLTPLEEVGTEVQHP